MNNPEVSPIRDLKSERHSFAVADGSELSYCVWSRDGDGSPKAVVLVLHGIGFHAEPYGVLAQNIDIPGVVYAGLDFRGHGRSDGERGKLPSVKTMLADVDEWVGHIKTMYPAADLYLLAESMAGPYGALYVARNPNSFEGVLFVAPATFPSWRQIFCIDTIWDVIGLLTRPNQARVDLSGNRLTTGGGSSEEVVIMRSGNSLAFQKISPAYVMRIGQAITRVVLGRTVKSEAPVLIIHGQKDNILSPMGSRLLIRKFRSPGKRLVIVPGAFHTMMWDSDSDRLFDILRQWLTERLIAR